MMGGFLLANPHHRNLIQTFIWLPLILYSLDKALIRQQGLWAMLAGLFMAISFLAGHANFFYFILLLIAFYFCFRMYLGIKAGSFTLMARETGYFVFMGIACLGLSALQLLPILFTGTGAYRETLDFAWKSQGSYPPANLISLLIPKWFIWTAEDFSDQLSYVGILPLLLGFWAIFRVADTRVRFYGLVALLSLLMAFGAYTPLYKILYDTLPGLHLFRIPSRTNCLLTFSLAVLSGFGCNHLLTKNFREQGSGLIEGTKSLLALALGTGAFVFLIWVYMIFQTGKDDNFSASWGQLLEGHILFLLILGSAYLILLGKNKEISPKVLGKSILILVALDLLVASLNFGPRPGGHMSDKDPALVSDQAKAILQHLKNDPGPYRISNTEGLLPPLLRYQENLTAYDVESMPNYVSLQFPREYLELYFRLEKNPVLVDLLNVRYHVGGSKPSVFKKTDHFQLGAAFRSQEFVLTKPLRLSHLKVTSFLSHSREISQGTTVAQISLYHNDRLLKTIPLRAGFETAEWAIDRPGEHFRHQKAQVADSWVIPKEGYEGHAFFYSTDVSPDLEITKILLTYLSDQGTLDVREILINGQKIQEWVKDRFELVTTGLFKNLSALPRVFTMSRAKALTEKESLAILEKLDPREYLLVDRLPAGYQEPTASGFSVEESWISAYSPHQINIVSRTETDKFLVLSDTHDPFWKASIDQKPAPIAKAYYGLRALYIPKGEHEIVFSYHFTPFYYGLAITALSLFLLLIFSAVTFIKRR
jgi:hypothetical protein